MSVTVEITVNNIEAVKELKRLAVKRGLGMIGSDAEGYAKGLCPVDTGNLKNSITHVVSEHDVIIGTNVEYAPYVEFGHTQEVGRYVPAIGKRLVKENVAPRPFLAPAVENHVAEYEKMIEVALKT